MKARRERCQFNKNLIKVMVTWRPQRRRQKSCKTTCAKDRTKNMKGSKGQMGGENLTKV